MAKINEQKITIKLSELLRDDEEVKTVLTDEQLVSLIQGLQETVRKSVMIELE